ncbi:helix-turn-helix domain-containing protein [Micromonospora sp. NPDC049900]|uniref:helix-turn-helix domain-containing protein n=1 Tax=Micromonospora sp. NPDC049900 TaxID=3364275 RepID=UPI003797FCCA
MTSLNQPRAVAPRSVRPAEAAALLGVCRDTVYVLMRSGRLRSIKAGRARLIPLAAIDEFLSADEEFAA